MIRRKQPWISPEHQRLKEQLAETTRQIELTQEMDRMHAVSEQIRQDQREKKVSDEMHGIKTPALEPPTAAEYEEMTRQMRNLPTEEDFRIKIANEEAERKVLERFMPWSRKLRKK
jgi:sugar phosphate isomerase/epimerase